MTEKKRSYKIMLVEDNEGDAVLAGEALKFIKSDSELIHVYNGDEAFEHLFDKNRVRPDLIMLDLNLPGMNGIEILQVLKKDPSTEKIPVIVFSTSSSENDISACYKLKANTYITKPLDLNEFFDVFKSIDEFLKKNVSI
jgi:CheY-like chemotaxis protein